MNLVKWTILFLSVHVLGACASNAPQREDFASDEVIEQSNDAASIEQRSWPIRDADNDTIDDVLDLCPGTDQEILVDSAGCDVEFGVIEGIKFGPNDTELSVNARMILTDMVDVFLRYPSRNIAVEGHTDNRGPAAENLELSKQRVLAVVRFLVTNGIDPTRIKPYGYGESRPRSANMTPEGRERNRRIEINAVESLL